MGTRKTGETPPANDDAAVIEDLMRQQGAALQALFAPFMPTVHSTPPEPADLQHWAMSAAKLQKMWLDFGAEQAGRIEPMLWISAGLVTVMGAMTVLLHDAFWIQIKPTFVYLLLAGALLGGWLRGKALLRYLMGPAFVGLDEEGWLTVSRNWGLLFVGFAVLNELARWRFNAANGGFGTWLTLKLWLFMPISVVFAMAHVPFLLRHGLDGEQPGENPDKAG
jgi:intracellular septation protein A